MTSQPCGRTWLRRRLAVLTALALTLGVAPAALAQGPEGEEAATDPVSVDLTVYALSDYRFRGISLTNKDPALQVELTATHESGAYATFFGSNIADNGGAGIEADFGVGYALPLGPATLDVSALYYFYPGASADSYAEFTSRLSAPVGTAEVGLTAAWSPAQGALGNEDNLYVGLDGWVPLGGTPFSLTASFGIEDGAFGDARRDWSLGASADLAGFTFGAAYVDTARSGGDPMANGGVVLSIARGF